APTEVITAAARACRTRDSPRVIRKTTSAPTSRTNSGRKAMNGEGVIGRWAAWAVPSPKAEGRRPKEGRRPRAEDCRPRVCPGGTGDNSPTFQRREPAREGE